MKLEGARENQSEKMNKISQMLAISSRMCKHIQCFQHIYTNTHVLNKNVRMNSIKSLGPKHSMYIHKFKERAPKHLIHKYKLKRFPCQLNMHMYEIFQCSLNRMSRETHFQTFIKDRFFRNACIWIESAPFGLVMHFLAQKKSEEWKIWSTFHWWYGGGCDSGGDGGTDLKIQTGRKYWNELMCSALVSVHQTSHAHKSSKTSPKSPCTCH